MRLILGCDPGMDGALAFLPADGSTPWVIDMPTSTVGKKRHVEPAVLAEKICRYMGDTMTAVVESVHSMPKQGVASSFEFGRGFGALLGVLAALQIPVTMVTPQKWKKAMGLGRDKAGSRALALRLWPALSGELARVKDEGRAEALLIAEWERSAGEPY